MSIISFLEGTMSASKYLFSPDTKLSLPACGGRGRGMDISCYQHLLQGYRATLSLTLHIGVLSLALHIRFVRIDS
jgi:hypothetical protein